MVTYDTMQIDVVFSLHRMYQPDRGSVHAGVFCVNGRERFFFVDWYWVSGGTVARRVMHLHNEMF